MEDGDKRQNSFIAYDYKEIVADSSKASFLLDVYESFGWELDENLSGLGGSGYVAAHSSKVVIRLKRNRKIMNKMELTRLQRNFEACVKEIETLESAKTSNATMYAIIVGIMGTAFMAGSVFAVTARSPHIFLCILLAIPAFLGWVFPYFIYKKTVSKQTARMLPLIEEKYDEIYELCEKGNKLLY